MQRFNLNGKWELKFKNLDEKVDVSKICNEKVNWYEAYVPGDVHLDMMKAGLIDDPFFGRNADHCIWMENKDWWYRKIFEVPKTFSGKNIYLRFDGLDTFATVFLNGEKIGEHKNMFTPLEIDVTKHLKIKGKNELLVKLASPIYQVNADLKSEISAHEPISVYTRKAAMSYSWDISPRLLTTGIWKNVNLIAFEEARITDMYVYADEVSRQSAVVSFEVEIQKEVNDIIKLEFETSIGKQREIIKIEQTEMKQKYTFKFNINNPKLWWPNGYGKQNLYKCRVRLLKSGNVIDTNESDIGIRKIELVQEPQSDKTTSFFFRVNDKDIFVKGFNWSPPDAIFARIDTKRYEELLKLVKECNANMMRVCGVGIYENKDFYRLCDRLGILIWQDFMMSGLIYPQEDSNLIENLKEEVEFVVKDFRNHPCIALWCGNNEGDLKLTNWSGSHHYFNRLTRELVPDILKKLDTQRPYIPSSPSSPDIESDPNECLSGDRHQYMQGFSYKHPDFFNYPCCPRFISETGYLSCPDKEVLRQFLYEEEMWPTDNKVWWYHSSDTMFIGSRYRTPILFDAIKNNGRPEPKNIDEFIRHTQEIQAEALVEWINIAAENPECGGILFWNLCDCWPEISDAVIGYPCKPKLAYKALREAFKKIKR